MRPKIEGKLESTVAFQPIFIVNQQATSIALAYTNLEAVYVFRDGVPTRQLVIVREDGRPPPLRADCHTLPVIFTQKQEPDSHHSDSAELVSHRLLDKIR